VAIRYGGVAGLKHFSQLLEETEHVCRWRQQKVAKIVPYGPPLKSPKTSQQRLVFCIFNHGFAFHEHDQLPQMLRRVSENRKRM
jgi:hypothetical protein